MTPLPKRRLSTKRQGKRRAAIKLSLAGLVRCSNCKSLTRPHEVCKHCGFYSGKAVIAAAHAPHDHKE